MSMAVDCRLDGRGKQAERTGESNKQLRDDSEFVECGQSNASRHQDMATGDERESGLRAWISRAQERGDLATAAPSTRHRA
eukprot:gene2364-8672_t